MVRADPMKFSAAPDAAPRSYAKPGYGLSGKLLKLSEDGQWRTIEV
jgi:hypothetical protein